jgi:hypothetical protein
MANVSLNASIRSCKVDSGYASKIQSDRYLNPGNMICPIWNGVDTAGRQASINSFNTKNAGCNSAEDRLYVENYQRPQYVEYVNLSAAGYQDPKKLTIPEFSQMKAKSQLKKSHNVAGNYGLQFGSNVYPNCSVNNYENGMRMGMYSQKNSVLGIPQSLPTPLDQLQFQTKATEQRMKSHYAQMSHSNMMKKKSGF